eukprot:scaffold177205_cov37-Prasinocladus_malaysianus.AAC.1
MCGWLELQELTKYGGTYAHLSGLSNQLAECRSEAQKGLASAEEMMNAEANEVCPQQHRFVNTTQTE